MLPYRLTNKVAQDSELGSGIAKNEDMVMEEIIDWLEMDTGGDHWITRGELQQKVSLSFCPGFKL